MKFYYFNGGDHTQNNKIKKLEESGFTGVLFTYDARSSDYFVKTARDIKHNQKIKYMIAIRPHAISLQYLIMINSGMKEIMPDRVQINLISGHIKKDEENVGGILGDVTDKSNNIERSNFLISFLEELEAMKKKSPNLIYPDCFVTVTNRYVFKIAKKFKQKMIIPYREFKQGHWTEYESYLQGGRTMLGEKIDLEGTNVMISLSPIIRKTKKELELLEKKVNDADYFSYEEFFKFINELENSNIEYLMLHPQAEEEDEKIIEFIKDFTNGDLKWN